MCTGECVKGEGGEERDRAKWHLGMNRHTAAIWLFVPGSTKNVNTGCVSSVVPLPLIHLSLKEYKTATINTSLPLLSKVATGYSYSLPVCLSNTDAQL